MPHLKKGSKAAKEWGRRMARKRKHPEPRKRKVHHRLKFKVKHSIKRLPHVIAHPIRSLKRRVRHHRLSKYPAHTSKFPFEDVAAIGIIASVGAAKLGLVHSGTTTITSSPGSPGTPPGGGSTILPVIAAINVNGLINITGSGFSPGGTVAFYYAIDGTPQIGVNALATVTANSLGVIPLVVRATPASFTTIVIRALDDVSSAISNTVVLSGSGTGILQVLAPVSSPPPATPVTLPGPVEPNVPVTSPTSSLTLEINSAQAVSFQYPIDVFLYGTGATPNQGLDVFINTGSGYTLYGFAAANAGGVFSFSLIGLTVSASFYVQDQTTGNTSGTVSATLV